MCLATQVQGASASYSAPAPASAVASHWTVSSYQIQLPGEIIRTVGDLLLCHLEDLTTYDFKRFRDKLSDCHGHKSSIPRGRLENADPVDTKNLLMEVYGEEAALEVMKEVFLQIGLAGIAARLNEQVNNLYCRIKYTEYVKNKYYYIKDKNARLADKVTLDKRYTRQLMIKKHRNEEERGQEITSSGRKHLQIMDKRASNEYSPITMQALFDPDEDGREPRNVVLQGPAGIGKTMTAKKIMLDWSSGKLYQSRFDYVFYVSCREISNITSKISFIDFISKICQLRCSLNVMKTIFENSHKILFIVDAFDELKWPLMKESEVCGDLFQEVSIEVILNSLFRNQTLEKASFIATTRPFALEKLEECLGFPCYVEILGFTEKDRKVFFYNFFERKEQADMALSIIEENEILFTMCSVPITCWIVCTVMKLQMEKGINVARFKTTTAIYMLYVKCLIKYHSRDSGMSLLNCMKKLCALAKEGIWKQKFMFEEEYLKKHGVNVSGVESLFLIENVFQRNIECYTCYSFIHLSIQEFFAALYYGLMEETVTKTIDSSETHFSQEDVMNLLESSKDSLHLTLTVRFLFGLCGEEQKMEIDKDFGWQMSTGVKCSLEEWLGNKYFRQGSLYSCSEELNCLYETQDEDFVKRMMIHFLPLHTGGTNLNYRALSYCLRNSPRYNTIHLTRFNMDLKAQETLVPELIMCRQLQLRSCNLTSACCEYISSVLIANTSLITLDLSENSLQDLGVKLLCDGLKQPDCILRELSLYGCDLTLDCVKDLFPVLSTTTSLIKLDLGGNYRLKDEGVQVLCEALRHPDCTLKELRLCSCDLTSACCEDLCSVLIINNSLIRLDLTDNKLQDSGVKYLCDGLGHSECTLQELR
ncbi:NACHT, LRR and PYD domains-containing protein 3-like [Rhinophrynus dorsalis]